MATTDANHSMDLGTQSRQLYPGNNPVMMLVAGLSCIAAGIVKLVQCGRQNQDDGNSENATVHGFEIARRAMIGLSFSTAGLSLIWKAYQLELVQHLSIVFHVIVIIFGLILIGYIQENGLQDISEIEISFIMMFPIIVVNFINGLAQELNPFSNGTEN